ncbi:glycoside hydrolase family 43 protein [Butyrivibrio sp. AE2015]|uniref:glycoside hydrolase family 43 protein n=1 Tax=Butyrivibrio sp. AE2015 TaxID=1280663 RepID=UPI0003B4F375|nr:glycoside hydrolase 43 family protein [Butyrivibrio sp. AE2015]
MSYSDLGSKYRNPIIFADYSDPDVIRVGDTYYLTASSFNYTPGLPILISKDLVNWKLVNYALNNIKEKRFDIPRHSEGVWAPAIRYHEGVFYIFYGMPDEGYYVVKTKDPLGEWDEPVCLLEGKGLIDCCPFWDDDGRAYIIHGYAKSRIGFKSILGIFEMSPDGTKALTEDHFIFNGNDPEHPAVTIEGPKVYKRDGYYHIWAPAGGVTDGYQVALRSKNIYGPYEIKEVMHTGNTVINGPHQGALVDTVNGDEWFIHFQDRGLYGRICHLQPVTWKDGWPIIGSNPDENGCGEPVYEYTKPNVSNDLDLEDTGLFASDDFENGKYNLSWQWLGNHYDSFYGQIPDKKNGLRLYALNTSSENEPVIWKSANVLTQKLIYPMFEMKIRMDASGLNIGDRAGVCMTGGQYMAAYIERVSDEKYVIKTIHSEGTDSDKKEVTDKDIDFSKICYNYELAASDALKDITWTMTFSHSDSSLKSEDMYFQNVHNPLGGENPSLKIKLSIGASDNEKQGLDLGANYTPSDHTWVGAKIGIFAISNNIENSHPGYADFISANLDILV